MIVMSRITGSAQVLIQGDLIATKEGDRPDALTCSLPPALTSVTLSLLVHAPAHTPGGLTGGVELVPNEPPHPQPAGGPGAG
jgi:hypothetical protein